MSTIIDRSNIFRVAGSLACALAVSCAAFSCAYAGPLDPGGGDWRTQSSGDGAPLLSLTPSKPSANNEQFLALRAKCETEVGSGKSNGTVCAEAAAILLGNDPPDNMREVASTVRTKIALRLLERGVDSSDIAAGRAFDIYNKTDIAGMLTGGVSDSYRANELMELMTKRNYPGATLRKARSSVSLFSIGTAESEKKQHCDLTKQLLAGGKLDADSKAIADEVLDSTACKNFALQALNPQNN